MRKYSSSDPEPGIDPNLAMPTYWVRMIHSLPATPGMHRYTWDLHYTPLPGGGGRGDLPISAVPHDTVPVPNSIWAAPGVYKVRLTVDGKSYTQPLTVKMDPRVKTPPPACSSSSRCRRRCTTRSPRRRRRWGKFAVSARRRVQPITRRS